MIQAIITAIQQELIGTLSVEQMKMLTEVLNKHLSGMETSESKEKTEEHPARLPLLI